MNAEDLKKLETIEHFHKQEQTTLLHVDWLIAKIKELDNEPVVPYRIVKEFLEAAMNVQCASDDEFEAAIIRRDRALEAWMDYTLKFEKGNQ